MNRILVVTDTWHPQVNGVVRSLEALAIAALEFGASVQFLTPQGFRSLRMPTYPEIRLAVTTASKVGRRIEALSVDHIHIATEGPLGFAARRYCLHHSVYIHINEEQPGDHRQVRRRRLVQGRPEGFTCSV